MEGPVVQSYAISIDESCCPRVAEVRVHLLAADPSLLSSEVREENHKQTFILEHGTSQLLNLSLPFAVTADFCTATWKRKAGKLIFRAPESVLPLKAAPTMPDKACDSQLSDSDDLTLLKEMYGDEIVAAPTIKAIHPSGTVQPTSTASVTALNQPSTVPGAAAASPALDTRATQEVCSQVLAAADQAPSQPQEQPCHEATGTSSQPACEARSDVPTQQAATQCAANSSCTPQAARSTAEPPSGAPGGMSLVPADEQHVHVQEAEALDCTNLALMLSSASYKTGLHQASAKKAAKTERKKVAAMLSRIAASLEQKGWAVCDNYVPIDLIIQARKEIKVMEDHYTEGEIWVGKDADVGATITRRDVRGDKVLWMDAEALAATAFVKDGVQRKCCFQTLSMVLKSVDRLVTGELPQLTHHLKHVRERSDAMLAIYPGRGARFAKHIDNTAEDGRRLTLLCYMNPNWRNSQGGALRLFPPGAEPVDVHPHAGRIAMFFSKTVAHEVMPTQLPRHSFTLWYYDALERAQAIAAARIAADGTGSVEAQTAARDLIRDILAGDVSAEGAVQADESGVEELQRRVAKLPTAAAAILASITGVASAQAFRDTVEAMEVSDLIQLRTALANMGLGHTPTV